MSILTRRSLPVTVPGRRLTSGSILAHSMLSHILVLVAYVIITLAVTSLLFDSVDRRFHTKELIEQAASMADMLAPDMAKYRDGASIASSELNAYVGRWGRLISSGVWVVAADGKVLVEPRMPRQDRPVSGNQVGNITGVPALAIIPRSAISSPALPNLELNEAELGLLGTKEARVVPTRLLNTRYVSAVYAPVISNGTYLGAIFLHTPRFNAMEITRGTRRALYLGAGIAFFFALAVSFQTSRRLARPLWRMRDTALQMAQGDFSAHLEVHSPEELAALAKSLNSLSDRLNSTLASLKDEKERFASLIEGMAEGVLAVDTDLQVILMNPPAKGYMGDLIGRRLCIQTPTGVSVIAEALQNVIREGKTVYLDVPIDSTPDHPHKAVLAATIAPISGTGAVAVLRDNTEERMYQALQQEFVANVSHELRTPLGLIQGYLEAIQDGFGNEPDKAQEFLAVVYNEAMRLRHMVEDLLTLSSLSADIADEEPVDLIWLINDTRRTMQTTFQQKQVSFVADLPEQQMDQLLVLGRADRLKQVLINLLDNALRYSDAGSQVKISVHEVQHQVGIQISDNGCGISPEHLPFIFNRFYRVEKERGRDTGGTGLGLAIVKSIVEKHHGEITVQSALGCGSTFQVLLPKL